LLGSLHFFLDVWFVSLVKKVSVYGMSRWLWSLLYCSLYLIAYPWHA
jgi:hypothetical protein